MRPEILVNHDDVKIEGKLITRPDSIKLEDWMRFWTDVVLLSEVSVDSLLENARREGYLTACRDHGIVILPQPESAHEPASLA